MIVHKIDLKALILWQYYYISMGWQKSTWEKYDLHNQQIYWLQDKNKNVNVTKCTHNMFIILIKTGLFLGVFFFLLLCSVYRYVHPWERSKKSDDNLKSNLLFEKLLLDHLKITGQQIGW